jgi:methyl-accepting chemotaxis protein
VSGPGAFARFADALRGAHGAAEEQRSRDLALFARLQRRRWLVIVASTGLLALAKGAGFVAAPLSHIAALGSVALAWSVAYEVLRRRGFYAWYHIYVSAAWDVLLVSLAVLLAGQGGLVLFYVLALAPYLLEADRPAGGVVALGSPFAYLATRVLHARWYEPASGIRTLSDLPAQAYLDALLLVIVALAMLRGPTALAARIRAARHVMGRAEGGDLTARADASADDELGYMERSFNQMLGGTGGTLAVVQAESDEVAAHAEELAAAASQFAEISSASGEAAARLNAGLAEQERLATESGERAADAAAESDSLRTRAAGMAGQARSLVAAAEADRASIQRAGAALLALGDQVRRGVSAVSALEPHSERIRRLATTIGGVARQTNLLALNASVEAARAGEHGQGFAVVAAEVRKLAGETAQAAREVADTVAEVHRSIESATATMQQGESLVHDVGTLAEENEHALAAILDGIGSLTALVDQASATSAHQAEAMASLGDAMRRMQELSAVSAAESAAAAQSAALQTAGAETLNQTARQLADLAERMRAAVARFTVAAPRGGHSR